MAFVIIGLTAALLALYLTFLLILRRGLAEEKYSPAGRPFISVIVPARNEKEGIAQCLEALAHQDYPMESHEVILVDDRSEDGTAEIIQAFCAGRRHFSLVRVSGEKPGMTSKKHALLCGIGASKGEILLFTDADCTPPPGWVRTLAGHFGEGIGLVAGFSPLTRYPSPSFWHRLVALDSLALAGVAASSFRLGYPLTCSGRNLAYRKKVFEDAGGFDSISGFVSGDDDLFMQQVRDRTKWRLSYATEEASFVPSIPPRSLKDLINQRTRHASKGLHYPAGMVAGLIGVYFLNLLLLLSPVLPGPFTAYALLFLTKAAGEWIFIARAASLFKQKPLLAYFPLAAVLHIPYVAILGLWGQIGRFSWKGKRSGATV